MICFEVSINGRKLCTAGVGQYGVLSTILSWMRKEPDQDELNEKANHEEKIYLHVGGLMDRTHFNWPSEDETINIGDEISIRIIETDKPDEPSERKDAGDPEVARRNRYELYQIYRREFEVQDKEGKPIEPIDPEEAKRLRKMVYEEYKQEFEKVE